MAGRTRRPRSVLERGLMTTNITPDKVRELLDTARQEATDGQRSVTVAASHAPLAEAAYSLAQTVASMYFMYAVQIEDVAGETRFAESAHGTTPDVRDAWWTSAPNTALADHWRENTNANDVRIVRRLMADPEVVE